MNLDNFITHLGQRARAAARVIARAPTAAKNDAHECARAREEGLSTALMDRLRLTERTIARMAAGLRQIAALPDPVGEIHHLKRRPSGIQVGQMRVPIGVIGIIYEARPEVTIDASALCLKAGNAAILRGSRHALQSN